MVEGSHSPEAGLQAHARELLGKFKTAAEAGKTQEAAQFAQQLQGDEYTQFLNYEDFLLIQDALESAGAAQEAKAEEAKQVKAAGEADDGETPAEETDTDDQQSEVVSGSDELSSRLPELETLDTNFDDEETVTVILDAHARSKNLVDSVLHGRVNSKGSASNKWNQQIRPLTELLNVKYSRLISAKDVDQARRLHEQNARFLAIKNVIDAYFDAKKAAEAQKTAEETQALEQAERSQEAQEIIDFIKKCESLEQLQAYMAGVRLVVRTFSEEEREEIIALQSARQDELGAAAETQSPVEDEPESPTEEPDDELIEEEQVQDDETQEHPLGELAQYENVRALYDVISEIQETDVENLSLEEAAKYLQAIREGIAAINRYVLGDGGELEGVRGRVKIEDEIKAQVVNPAQQITEQINDRSRELLQADTDPVWQQLRAIIALNTATIPNERFDGVITALEGAIASLARERARMLDAVNGDENHPKIEFFDEQVQQVKAKLEHVKERKEEVENERTTNAQFQALENILARVPNSTEQMDREGVSTADLQQLRQELERVHRELINAGAFAESTAAVTKISQRYESARQQIDRLLEPKPVELMTIGELASEIIRDRIDPFRWADFKVPSGAPQRTRDIVNEFVRKAMGTPSEAEILANPEAEIERIVHKVRVQMNAVDNALQDEGEKASGNRSNLFTELQRTTMNRRELLIATTYHPEWGEQIREMLEFVYKTAALRSGEVVVERNGEEVVILENQVALGENIKYKHNSRLFYGSLSGEQGRTRLGRALEQYSQEHFPNINPLALELANELFTSFDLLTISLTELQKKTMTRGHNTTGSDEDRVMYMDPLASMIHRCLRYGGNKEDWSLWFLVYLEDIPPYEQCTRGEQLGKNKEDHEWLREKQHMLKKHQSVFYPIEPFAGKVERAGFCQPQGLSTWDLITLNPASETLRGEPEKIWLFDHYVDANDQENYDPSNLDRPGEKETNTNLEFYQLAEQNGWGQLLELVYKSLSTGDLTKHQILYETKEGGKGGLLGDFFQIAGRAKMFPGPHLRRFIAPMLTHYIYRIFQVFDQRNNSRALEDLWKEVVKEVKDSQKGGLSDFSAELDEVLANISDGNKIARALRPKENYRDQKRKEYLNEWWRHERHSEPPGTVVGIRLPGLHNIIEPFRGKDLAAEEYMQYLNGYHALPQPASRSGSMLQPKEKE